MSNAAVDKASCQTSAATAGGFGGGGAAAVKRVDIRRDENWTLHPFSLFPFEISNAGSPSLGEGNSVSLLLSWSAKVSQRSVAFFFGGCLLVSFEGLVLLCCTNTKPTNKTAQEVILLEDCWLYPSRLCWCSLRSPLHSDSTAISTVSPFPKNTGGMN